MIKKSNTEYIWQKLEEKNMMDIYTGLLNEKGFISKLQTNDRVMLFSFPQSYRNMQYFVPIVSAALRSDNRIAAFISETVFSVVLTEEKPQEFIERLCCLISELGIFITETELTTVHDKIWHTDTSHEQVRTMYNKITEKKLPQKQ